MLKLHICPNHLTPRTYKISFPICGKISDAIEFDTISLEDFLKADTKRQCKRCLNQLQISIKN